jgi:hypothetical protein
MTRSFPLACIIGTVGCAMAAEGIANVGLRDLENHLENTRIGRRVRETADAFKEQNLSRMATSGA